MKSLRAKISNLETAERRGNARWRVELVVSAGSGSQLGRSVVRDLSDTGLMIETDAALGVGEIIRVDLPGAEPVDACVVWCQDYSYGCKFLTPIPSSVVSAALLQAPLDVVTRNALDPLFEEFPVAVRPSVSELADWKKDFQKTHGAKGYRLLAFRQTSDGLFIAIAAKQAGS